MSFFAVAAGGVLVLHLAWLLFVIFGAFWTRRRRILSAVHIAALAWGLAVEVGPWPCPLTFLEQYLQEQAGITPYRQPFLVHYAERLVYPDIPSYVLVFGAVVVCLGNLFVYLRRFRARPATQG